MICTLKPLGFTTLTPIYDEVEIMKGGLGNIMKQAQQMQANMQKLQEELARTEVTGPVRRRHGQRDHERSP